MTQHSSMCIKFNLAEHSYKQITLDELEINEEEKNTIFWLHCNLNQKDFLKTLTEKLHLSDNFISLCDDTSTMAKLIDTGESLTLRIQCLISEELKQDQELIFDNLIIHLTEQYCLTASYTSIPALEAFTEFYPKIMKYAKTACSILFLTLDNIINDYSNILFDLDFLADQINLKSDLDGDNIYKEVMDIKNQVMKIKHQMVAVRDILMRISGRKIAVISEDCRLSLGNLFDHSQMVVSETDAIRDILNSTLDKIDNALMQKMNETMRILTAFAAIFLPMTLISGIYGMNFHWIPELDWKYGYFWALFLMLLCGGSLLYLFKKKKWF